MESRNCVAAALALCVALCAGIAQSAGNARDAFAMEENTPRFAVRFDYAEYYCLNANAELRASGENATVARVMTGETESAELGIDIWGGKGAGDGGEFSGYINCPNVALRCRAGAIDGEISVRDSAGAIAGSGRGSVKMTGLSDGRYEFEAVGNSESWLLNGRESAHYRFVATGEFWVDLVPPEVTGGTTDIADCVFGCEVEIRATDALSGVDSILLKRPGHDEFERVGAARCAIRAHDENGLYEFCALDRVGNRSASRYARLDTIRPVGKLSANGAYCSGAFSYSATDSGSGVVRAEMRRPGGAWEECALGAVVPATAANGQYSFRACDAAGNVSDVKSIILDTVAPEGTLYSDGRAVPSGTHCSGTTLAFECGDAFGVKNCFCAKNGGNARAYASGSQICEDGEYVFYAVDNAGNRSEEYRAIVDKAPPEGAILDSDGAPLTSEFANADFSFAPSEPESGLLSVECRRPGRDAFEPYAPRAVISRAAPNGAYAFRATDLAGNMSEIYEIFLDSAAPRVEAFAGGAALSATGLANAGPIRFVATDSGSGVAKMRAKGPNESEFASVESPFERFEDGRYEVFCADAAGNVSDVRVAILDTVCPVGGFDVEGAAANRAFEYLATDSGSGVRLRQCLRPGSDAWEDVGPDECRITGGAPDGEYLFRSFDAAGNASEVSAMIRDTVGPTGAFVGPSGPIENNSIVLESDVEFVARDERSGVANAFFRRDSEPEYSVYAGAPLAETGKYLFYAADNAGNKSERYALILDFEMPTGVIQNASGEPILAPCANSDFLFAATDSFAGIARAEVLTPDASDWAEYELGSVVSRDAPNGAYRFRAFDLAGNCSEIVEITLDSVGPDCALRAGAERVASGARTNAAYVAFDCSDAASGIAAAYAKTPGAASYSDYAPGAALIEQGEYAFFCEDGAHNRSEEFVITLDNAPPTLSCSETEFFSDADSGFSVSAADNFPGVALYFRPESEAEYSLCADATATVLETDPRAKYFFYALDASGNATDPVWIRLCVEYPEATIETDAESNTVVISWLGPDIGQLNGLRYEKNTPIREEGAYSFVLTNAKNRSRSYEFEISHSYRVSEIVEPTCVERGYTAYECISCGQTYVADYVEPLGHDYVATVKEATCVDQGGTHWVCARCGDEYVADPVPPFGHSYEESVIAPTCEEKGCVRHVCSVCGYSYDTDVVPAVGHDFASEVKKKPTCVEPGLRVRVCRVCGLTEEIPIPATGHAYEISGERRENGARVREYKCKNCGAAREERIDADEASTANLVARLFAKYRKYMFQAFLATCGVWSAAMGAMLISAKRRDDRAKAARAVKNYVIGLIAIAGIMVACPFLVNGIASLVA